MSGQEPSEVKIGIKSCIWEEINKPCISTHRLETDWKQSRLAEDLNDLIESKLNMIHQCSHLWQRCPTMYWVALVRTIRHWVPRCDSSPLFCASETVSSVLCLVLVFSSVGH